uniref:Putative transposase n=1 Tax=Streptomyces hygroscopicus subsp. hygroscopicus TaxID=68042 RepID=Q2MFT1_STRHY|nr:putative transposase [Streptomyces hygroscopicus subsp. hygroscopicus]
MTDFTNRRPGVWDVRVECSMGVGKGCGLGTRSAATGAVPGSEGAVQGGRLVVGELRVQEIVRGSGRVSEWAVRGCLSDSVIAWWCGSGVDSSGPGSVVWWAGRVSERKPYPGDLSDGRWALIESVVIGWKGRHGSVSGHQGVYDVREIVIVILCQGRTGCQWAWLPHGLPPKSATYCYFVAWGDDGTGQVVHEFLRCQVRERARRWEDRTLVVLDTQSVHVAAGVPAATTGHDPAKRVPGRKRGLAVDVLGLVIVVVVLVANVHDNAAGVALLSEVAVSAGGNVSKALVDQGFKVQVVRHGAGLGIDVEIVQRGPQHKGFVPQPKRWRVEQTYGVLILHRRPVCDYETALFSSSSRVYWAMTHVMVRRLTGVNVPTWREAAVAACMSSLSFRHWTSARKPPGRRPTTCAGRSRACGPGCARPRHTSGTSRSPARPSPASPAGSPPPRRNCPSIRTTPASCRGG